MNINNFQRVISNIEIPALWQHFSAVLIIPRWTHNSFSIKYNYYASASLSISEIQKILAVGTFDIAFISFKCAELDLNSWTADENPAD